MKERVSGSRYTERPRVERTTVLAASLRSLPEEEAKIFLAAVLYNAPDEVIAGKLQIPVSRVRRRLTGAASKLRHPSRATELRNYVYGLDSSDPTILIDDDLRSLIREWHLDEMFDPLCLSCGAPLEPTRPTLAPRQAQLGRPRRYCSNACRQKAYRARHR
ncbi:sigma factor-like helix-turn-helix DNA-binding protein [Streptomyces aureus]